MLHRLERGDQAVEVRGRRVAEQVSEILPVRCDKLADRGHDMLGSDVAESRQR